MTTTVDEYLTALPESLRPVGDALCGLLDTTLAHATGRMWHGHPVWMVGKTPVAGFKAYRRYVTFMVWRGPRVGESVKVGSVGEVELVAFTTWLAEAEPLAA
jgi:hypothetical protein